jgi:hypothetical protein
MAEIKDIFKLTAMLSAAYPNWNVTEFTNEVYYQDLKDIPTDVLFVAAQHCRTSTARDQRFAPSAGEIRAAAGEIKRQVQGVPSGLEAWGELLHVPTDEQIKSVTDEKDEEDRVIIEVRTYQWSHPLVRKVAFMMGFPRFPDWESESFERTAFLKAYEIELQNYLKQDNQPQEVKNFIADQKDPALLMAEKKIKQLTEGMEK